MIRRRTRWATAFVALFVSGTAVADAPASGNNLFDSVVDLVEGRFYDAAALPSFENIVRRIVEDPTAPLDATSSSEQVNAAIGEVLASLHASHTAHLVPGTTDYYELVDIFGSSLRRDLRRLFPQGNVSYDGVGMATRAFDGRVFVTDVYDGSSADRAGVLVGDEILSVNGEPFAELNTFDGMAGKAIEVQVRRTVGADPLRINVDVEAQHPLDVFERAIADSATVMERDGRNIAYIRLWTLAAPNSMRIVARELIEGSLKDADGLVLDLRGRWGGGSADDAELFVGGTPTFHLNARDEPPDLANARWDRPVVAIIDDGARSGLELFAYSLQANGIPLIGTRTAGALLGGRAFVLADRSLLVLAVADAVIGDGIRLEGVGVAPDIEVPFDPRYAAGEDPQLDAAMQEMSRILSAS